MANNNRRRKWVIGLVGLSAMAAAVVPKNVWEALLMEGSSSHSVKLQRGSNGQIAATSPQGPPGSYKPLLPAPPTSSAPPAEAIVPAVGVGPIGQDVVGTWKVFVRDQSCVRCPKLPDVPARLTVDAQGTVSFRCMERRKGLFEDFCENEMKLTTELIPTPHSFESRLRDPTVKRSGDGEYSDSQDYLIGQGHNVGPEYDPQHTDRGIFRLFVSGNELRVESLTICLAPDNLNQIRGETTYRGTRLLPVLPASQ